MRTFAREFREFAMKGNIVDLAVAVIIGAAFGKIVSSLVEDIVMPAIGAVGRVDFLIIALAIFLAIKVMNRLYRREEAKPAPPPRQEILLEEIRDLLRRKP